MIESLNKMLSWHEYFIQLPILITLILHHSIFKNHSVAGVI